MMFVIDTNLFFTGKDSFVVYLVIVNTRVIQTKITVKITYLSVKDVLIFLKILLINYKFTICFKKICLYL